MTWNPEQYFKFSDHRLRPALDLIGQIPLENPKRIYDLGCGPGNVTRLLAERWPDSQITGIDSSPEMISKARASESSIDWIEADIATWEPTGPADIIFSNAALHWLDNHQGLFPRLLSMLTIGGVLAVQMPRNHGAPSHVLMAKVARLGPWEGQLAMELREAPVDSPEAYYDLMSSDAVSLNIWESEYAHILEGDAPVLEWVRGTALKPLLDALDRSGNPDWKTAFLNDYSEHLKAAYPRRGDDRTLFPFRRLFMVAVK